MRTLSKNMAAEHGTWVFGPVIDMLETVGYVPGKSIRAFPYDWRCPPCKLQERDGYFTGAMYFSYGIGVVLVIPTVIFMFLRQVDEVWIGLAALAQLAILSPLLFRYARVAWMHMDQRIDPQ